MSKDFEDILYAVPVASRPSPSTVREVRNAVRPQTRTRNSRARASTAADDPEIGVVVLTGAGDKAFCSGGDVARPADAGTRNRPHPHATFVRAVDGDAHDRQAYDRQGARLLRRWRQRNQPVLRPHNRERATPSSGRRDRASAACRSGARASCLRATSARRKAREMIYTCRLYTAQQALEMGLINEVVRTEDLDARVERSARKSSTRARRATHRQDRAQRRLGSGVLQIVFPDRGAARVDLRQHREHGGHHGLPRRSASPTSASIACDADAV